MVASYATKKQGSSSSSVNLYASSTISSSISLEDTSSSPNSSVISSITSTSSKAAKTRLLSDNPISVHSSLSASFIYNNNTRIATRLHSAHVVASVHIVKSAHNSKNNGDNISKKVASTPHTVEHVEKSNNNINQVKSTNIFDTATVIDHKIVDLSELP
ncbi:hypothetical protein MOUN0_H07800 [Monosporozyma unispora]